MRFSVFIFVALFTAGCSTGDAAVLSATEIVVNRPLPGTSMSAAYLTLTNKSDEPILLTSVTSPQFARIEMHESIIENDISRMQRIDELWIEAGQSTRFEPGGKHLMLMQAREPLQSVTLNFYSGDALKLSVNTSMSTR